MEIRLLIERLPGHILPRAIITRFSTFTIEPKIWKRQYGDFSSRNLLALDISTRFCHFYNARKISSSIHDLHNIFNVPASSSPRAWRPHCTFFSYILLHWQKLFFIYCMCYYYFPSLLWQSWSFRCWGSSLWMIFSRRFLHFILGNIWPRRLMQEIRLPADC